MRVANEGEAWQLLARVLCRHRLLNGFDEGRPSLHCRIHPQGYIFISGGKWLLHLLSTRAFTYGGC